MGQLVFQATLGGQVNLVGPNTASTFNINVPAIAGTMVTTGDTGTVTNTMLATSVYTAPGTIGSGTPNTGAFTTLSASSTVTINGGTANGVAYLNGSKVLTTGSALTFDGSNFGGAVNVLVSDNKAIGFGSNAYWLGNSASGFIAGYINGSEGMRLTSTGLGIGTSSPSKKLDVQGATASGQYVSTTGTNVVFHAFSNTGGGMIVGQEGSAGSALVLGTSAYSGVLGTVGAYPLSFATNNNERMRLDSSGNLGLGVTPSAWGSGFKAFEVGRVGSGLFSVGATSMQVTNNYYYNGSNYIYAANGAATRYHLVDGQHQWYNAASGTAGNAITFTQAMTLDASGNLLVGKTALDITTVGGQIRSNGQITSTLSGSTNATDTLDVYSTGAGAYRFYVGMGGTIFATSIVISAISDERLKENVRDLDTGLDSIMTLKPRRFDWKEGKGQDKKNAAGFIAQEFEEVFPESVSASKAGADGIEYKNINHETLIPTLVKAIQEQQVLIESLTTRLASLESN